MHSGLVLARADTRNLTRAWLVAHVPAGTPIVVEPVSPDAWGRMRPEHDRIPRWTKYPSLVSRISSRRADPTALHACGIEDYERTLSPALLSFYERTATAGW